MGRRLKRNRVMWPFNYSLFQAIRGKQKWENNKARNAREKMVRDSSRSTSDPYFSSFATISKTGTDSFIYHVLRSYIYFTCFTAFLHSSFSILALWIHGLSGRRRKGRERGAPPFPSIALRTRNSAPLYSSATFCMLSLPSRWSCPGTSALILISIFVEIAQRQTVRIKRNQTFKEPGCLSYLVMCKNWGGNIPLPRR